MKGQGFPATVGYFDGFWVCAASHKEALKLLEFLGLKMAWDKCEVVLITDNTPTKGMLEHWRCQPDFTGLLRRIFKQCVTFDVRFILEWVPSKEKQFTDALTRKQMKLFFDLYWD
ncbi:hypothetical protein CYMTET_12944 [Cymbomonas tetramitiformis]|uniref:Reverse transcriptase RNase H-like domain-containing protein n=1 Tax=Cymbomonas tetramitiformis TaxID=36881 RepID=A0AAE0LBJ3_9CHLO|nr:hypothetical protein CYMTET_12944 [Cymbomonas tetramitiformis]